MTNDANVQRLHVDNHDVGRFSVLDLPATGSEGPSIAPGRSWQLPIVVEIWDTSIGSSVGDGVADTLET
eukprot:CAMPEP_0169273154 /NCGR_PEP_ID=MMETSP1016-20121227/50920_1 /TAXON_ID=342587 /ORGANISM="Karlodinium micrum, Strain CCMP2283" /LENGTH=68 /DNA_ID=CAMNT_0009359389 /DNA_START=36 /DNA_END=239 /DNA_ORIENTATION=-